jgi:ribonucleoside-diphosphate reductase alpha chain
MRERLPERRQHELFEIDHAGIRYVVGVGRFRNGDLAEIFLNAPKTGTAAAVNAQDAAIAASLLFQHGCPVETLRRALTRNPDGSAAGPLGAVLDLLNGAQA